MSNQVPIQIPLSVDVRGNARFENFLSQGNELAITSLKTTAQGQGEHFTFLWGTVGAGVSHLLKASSYLAEAAGRSTEYVRLDQLADQGPSALDKWANVSLLCLDNLQAVAGLPDWEEAIFHLFNERRDYGRSLIIAADAAPRHLSIKLADLASRLSWGMVFHVHPLDDEFKPLALTSLAKERGIELREDVVQFLLSHSSRDMSEIVFLLDQLDEASLSAKRKVTIPFVKEVTGL